MIYIYIITHPKFKGWIKLGRTTNLLKRLDSYQTGCPYRKYYIEYSKLVDYNEINLIENYFRIKVSSNGFEWYKCSVKYAINLIEDIILNNISNINTTIKDNKLTKRKYIYIVEDNNIQCNTLKELLDFLNFTQTDMAKICNGFQYKNPIIYKDYTIRREKVKQRQVKGE